MNTKQPSPGWWPCLIPLLLGGGLILFHLARPSLWLDEIMSSDFTDGSFGELFQWLRGDVHGPLFFLWQMPFVHLVRDPELACRLPSAIAGIATIFLVYMLGWEMGGARLAWRSALILSILPLFIEFSREGRPQMLGALWSAAAWLYFFRLARHGAKRDALLYGVCCGLLLLTFYFGALNIFAQGLTWLLLLPALRKWRALALALLAAMILFAPWLPIFSQHLRANGIGILSFLFPHGIGWGEILFWFDGVLFGTLIPSAAWRAWLSLAIWSALLVFCLWPHRVYRAHDEGKLLASRTWLIPMMVYPAMMLFILYCLRVPALLSRYMVILLPAIALLLAQATLRLPVRFGRFCITLIVMGGLGIYPVMLRELPRTDWRTMATWLTAHVDPQNDFIVADHVSPRSCLMFYFSRLGADPLRDHTLDYDTFYPLAGGRFIPPRGRMFYVASHGAQNAAQLAILKRVNYLEGSTQFHHGTAIYTFSHAR